MKKIAVVVLCLMSGQLMAQQTIPNPLPFARQLFQCLKEKDTVCLNKQFMRWEEIEPLFDSMLNYRKTNKLIDGPLPNKDSVHADYNLEAHREFLASIDTFFARTNRLHVTWSLAEFMQDRSVIKTDADMPDGIWFTESKIRFRVGDASYKFGYSALLVNNQWKLANINPIIEVYNNEGKVVGQMANEYRDYTQYPTPDNTQQQVDTTAFQNVQPTVPEKNKQSAPQKTKPQKGTKAGSARKP